MNRLLILTAMTLLASAAYSEEVVVGKPAPDFSVTGIDGKSFKLSDKTGAGKNVALMFSRAHW